jgi:hypothetical protein
MRLKPDGLLAKHSHRDVDLNNTPDAFILDKEFIQASADQMKAFIREYEQPKEGQ